MRESVPRGEPTERSILPAQAGDGPARLLPAPIAAWHDSFRSELARVLSGESVWRQNEPLARKTTFRVGGTADFYVEPATESELSSVVQLSSRRRMPWRVLGRGSNVLVRDGGVRGVVVCLASPVFSAIRVNGDRIECGAGVKLKEVATAARKASLGGFEFLEGIPGSVGGGLRMNAGAMGSSLFDRVERLRLMDADGQIEEPAVETLQVGYRDCPELRNRVALGALLRGCPGVVEEIEARTTEYNRRRWSSQPASVCAGCVFKNPAEGPAGRLIDELGLKGLRVGRAVVSEMHGNFIVNEGGATASEILRLIDLVRERVWIERGVLLEPELEVLGEDE